MDTDICLLATAICALFAMLAVVNNCLLGTWQILSQQEACLWVYLTSTLSLVVILFDACYQGFQYWFKAPKMTRNQLVGQLVAELTKDRNMQISVQHINHKTILMYQPMNTYENPAILDILTDVNANHDVLISGTTKSLLILNNVSVTFATKCILQFATQHYANIPPPPDNTNQNNRLHN